MKHEQKSVERAVEEAEKRAATDKEKARNEGEASRRRGGADGGGAPIDDHVISYLPALELLAQKDAAPPMGDMPKGH